MRRSKNVLALLLTLVMILSCVLPVGAVNADNETNVSFVQVDNSEVGSSPAKDRLVTETEETPTYKDTDTVRVSIVLEADSTIKRGFGVEGIAENSGAMSYRRKLQLKQDALAEKIAEQVLGGEELDVVWNLTLAANIISANVAYGDIEAIESVDGVASVVIETRYEPDVVSVEEADPNMATSSDMIGSGFAWGENYTGAGSRIAVIDTGTDTDHQSFNADAFAYAIEQTGKDVKLMTADDIAKVLDKLNIAENEGVTAEKLYLNAKLPFAYNYVDEDFDITHDNDKQGEHGSHVAGIATANRYIPDGEGGFVDALDSVLTQGVAPDAQLITMKVFGKNGGAYDSDYMAAIEDAIVLGCDSINLSLGSGNPGMSTNSSYQEVLDSLTKAGAVVCISAGNSGTWQENSYPGALYNTDVSMSMTGSPGTYTNSLGVASIDNTGNTGNFLRFGDLSVVYNESTSGNNGETYTNASILTLVKNGEDTEYDFVFFNNTGKDSEGNNLLTDYADVTEGKVVLIYRGGSYFYEKPEAVQEVNGIACVVVNNQPGTINMDLSDASATIPCVSITQASGEEIKAIATAVYDEDGTTVLYYTGKITVSSALEAVQSYPDYYTMSSFSSWGVPGSLEMKPEITAPGGNIYSVNGAVEGGTAYENMSGTSMAAPQVTGMVAVLAQYIRENKLTEKTGLTQRQLAQSLLMSTATPVIEEATDYYYSILNQGAGLANVADAINAHSFIMMAEGANAGAADGKVKVELGDDPERNGVYEFSYTLTNLSDETANYYFNTDVFTQDVYDHNGDSWLDTRTRSLDAYVTYFVDGEELAGLEDAYAILEYCAGACGLSEEDLERYDIDGDGEVTTHDAHMALSVKVPVGESIDVTVVIDVTGCDFSAYPNGAYIEAYSYAVEEDTEEGVAGTVHSIPVLGFYGNWSDSSMYDVGTLAEYAYDMESRAPYLLKNTECYTNVMTVKYPGDSNEYYFYGNPMAYDDEYLEERNAFNSDGSLFKYYYSVIRNAGDALAIISDAETGDIYYVSDLGKVNSAYYYSNGGTWQSTQYDCKLDWNGTDLEGEKLEEDTVVKVSLVLAPEYYASDDGSYDWNALLDGVLGEGAYLTTVAAIDNTAPTMTKLVHNSEKKTLTVTASDNRYIAIVALYLRDGTMVDYVLPNQQVEDLGEAGEYALDVSELEDGAELYVQVTDYAMNQTTYKLVLGDLFKEAVAPTKITVDPAELTLVKGTSAALALDFEPWIVKDGVKWESDDEDIATVNENGIVTGVSVGETTITVTSTETYGEGETPASATCKVTVKSFDVTLNGMLQDEDGNPQLFTWNMETDNTWKKTFDLENNIISATYGGDVVYQMNSSGYLFTVDPATGETLTKSDAATAIGVEMEDMEYAYRWNEDSGEDVLFGIYGGYFLYSAPAMDNDFTRLWNLNNYLSYYTDSSAFVALAWAGYMKNKSGNVVDVFYALTDNGYIWQLAPDMQTGSVGLSFFKTDLSFDFTHDEGAYYSSMVMGEDDNLYLSAFNGDTNEIYVLEETPQGSNVAYTATLLGDIGDAVWPCALLSVSPNKKETPTDPAETTAIDFEPMLTVQAEELVLPAVQETAGSLNAVKAEQTATAAKRGIDSAAPGRLYVDLTAENTTNGLVTLTYDPDVLTFEYVDSGYGTTEFRVGTTENTVTVAFASAETINEKIGTVIFSYDTNGDSESTDITVTTREDGTDFTVSSRVLTLTTNGHTHKYTDVVTAPTCTAQGYTTHTCACGHSYVDTMVAATGHKFGEWVTVRPATQTSNGLEARTCSACDTVETRELEALGAGCCYYKHFADCISGWYHEAVDFVSSQNLMKGMSESSFAPNESMTRAMVVTVLYRMAGSPEVKSVESFSDVEADRYYSAAIAWAKENKIVDGMTPDTFCPEMNVTREQIATILWRYEGKPKATAKLPSFNDADEISAYALDALTWAASEGIFAGDNNDDLRPTDNATRAEFATVIMRYLNGSYICR